MGDESWLAAGSGLPKPQQRVEYTLHIYIDLFIYLFLFFFYLSIYIDINTYKQPPF